MINDFGSFSLNELSRGIPFEGANTAGIWYDPSRDIAWLVLCQMTETNPSSVWLGEDDRMQAAAHLDEHGRILSVAIGDASRHMPPYVMLAGDRHEVRIVSSSERDLMQVLLCGEDDIEGATALTMVSESVGSSIHFVRDSSAMLVAVVVDPASRLAHPSVLPWLE